MWQRLVLWGGLLGSSVFCVTLLPQATPTSPPTAVIVAPSITATPTPILFPALQDRSWLTGEPCAPPCWYGMAIGKTTKAEALQIVQGLSFVEVENVSEEIGGFWDEEETVRSHDVALPCKKNHQRCATLFFVDDSLEKISLRLNYSVTLGEVVAALGAPDYMYVYGSDVNCELELVWPKQQLIVTYSDGPLWFHTSECELMIAAGNKPAPYLVPEYVDYLPLDYFPENPEDYFGYVDWVGLADP